MNLIARLVLVVCVGFAISDRVAHYRKSRQFENVTEQLSVIRLVNGELKSEELDLSKYRYLALYHSASWCGPCQAFSPRLSEFYHSASKGNFELVMINHDRSAADMAQYMKQHRMEFPAILEADAGVWGKAPSGTGIPNLVIFDMQTHKVIEESFNGGTYQGPDVPLQALREKLSSPGR